MKKNMLSFRKVFFSYLESIAVIRAWILDQVRHDEIQQTVIC
jgi:hypothetical protein